jgi:hypothetical protein
MSDPGANTGLLVEARLILPDGGLPIVGVPFTLVIEARHAPGSIALLPESLGLPAELAERPAARSHTRSVEGSVEIDRYELELLGFDPGEQLIPAIPLACSGTVAKTKPLSVQIGTGFSEAELPIATSTQPEALAELEKMAAQDAPPLPVYVADYRPAFALLFLLIAAITGWAVWRHLKAKARRPIPGPPPPPPRPAHLVALEALATLEAAGHLAAGRHKAFYSELSEVMRAWAGARYNFVSLDLTVPELMEALGQKDRPGLEAARLERLLTLADLVKFAKFTPTAADGEGALSDARAIVKATTPAEPTP